MGFSRVGIYWNNHHHLFQAVKHIRGAGPLAKSPFAFLVVFNSIGNGMVGSESFHAVADGLVWICTLHADRIGRNLYFSRDHLAGTRQAD